MVRRQRRAVFAAAGFGTVLILAGCSGNYGANESSLELPPGPVSNPNQLGESVFGDGGLSLSSLSDGSLFGDEEGTGGLPVNKYLWQAALDTLSFMPLASTDPYTGVITTDWSTTPDAPTERFKVTVYIVTPELAASALKVAVYREGRTEDGLWVPRPVSPETPLKIEDAVLTRARQIRIAEVQGEQTG